MLLPSEFAERLCSHLNATAPNTPPFAVSACTHTTDNVTLMILSLPDGQAFELRVIPSPPGDTVAANIRRFYDAAQTAATPHPAPPPPLA